MHSENETSVIDLTPDWLAQRFRFDMASRSKQLERQFLQNLPSKTSLRLVDLGSGTGANFFYLANKIPHEQHWILVDHSKQLLAELPENFRRFASCSDQNTLTTWLSRLHSGDIRFEVVEGDFYQIASKLFDNTFDAITANAVFDLSSLGQFRQLIETISASASCEAQLYFTLHLNRELKFRPNHPLDDAVRDAYHQHMARPQQFGNAMGADAAEQMKQVLITRSRKVEATASPWQIPQKQKTFFRHNLDFMRSALLGSESSPALKEDFKAWFALRYQQLSEKPPLDQLEFFIGHEDILAQIR